MKIVNHTRLGNNELRMMVSLIARGISRRINTLTISYTRKHVYKGHYSGHKKDCYISIAFAKRESDRYPFNMNAHRHAQFNFPQYEVNDEYEACLAILAHELYHLRARVHGWKGTEKKAEDYAFKTLQRFRTEFWEL